MYAQGGTLHTEHGIRSSPAFISKSPHSLQAAEVFRDEGPLSA